MKSIFGEIGRVGSFILPLTALLVGGCVEEGATRPEDTPSGRAVAQIDQSLRVAKAQPPDALNRAQTLPQPMPDQRPQPARVEPKKQQRIDVAVENAPAKVFFMSLSGDNKTNIVVHPAVTGEISLNLKGVTLEEVLDVVRQTYGYEYERNSIGYVILPHRMQSRMYFVNYLNVRRKGASETRVNTGAATKDQNERTQETNNTVGTVPQQSDGGLVTKGATTSRETVVGSRIVTEHDVDFWAEVKESINALIGDGEGRSVIVSPHSGMVMVRAMPSELREVELFLRSMERAVVRQVILEAKVIDVELGDGFQSGINWGALVEKDGKTLTFGQTGGGTLLQDGTPLTGGSSDIQGQEGNLDPNNPGAVSNLLTSAFGGMFSLMYQSDNFMAFIELLETQGEVHVLSSPRVSTVNNQKAVIKVGSEEYFVTDVSVDTNYNSGTTTITPDIQLAPFFSGIALDVTPHIGGDDSVILHIHPTISEVTDQIKSFVIGGNEQSLPLAYSKVRESDSIIRARNGQVVVIGGLMQDISKRMQADVPWLADIPYLGELFRHRNNKSRKTELVILLRPVVINSNDVWVEAMSENRQFLDQSRTLNFPARP